MEWVGWLGLVEDGGMIWGSLLDSATIMVNAASVGDDRDRNMKFWQSNVSYEQRWVAYSTTLLSCASMQCERHA